MKGNLTRRGKSSWRAKFDLLPSPDGKRRTVYETIRAGSKKEAQAALTERLAAIGRGTFVEPAKLTVASHVRARIEVWYSAGTIGNASRERYTVLLRKQIDPYIGGVVLQKLGTKEVEEWHAKLRATGLAPRTVRSAHRLLGKALRDGVRHGLLTRSVAGRDGQGAPPAPTKEPDIIRADQIADVVARLRGRDIYPHAMLALFAGLRLGEVLALRWSSVDFETNVLMVKESIEEIAGQPLTTKAPKTRASRRKLVLPIIVVDALRDHRRKQLEFRMAAGLGRPADDALAFPGPDGGLSRRSGLSTEWGETAEALGLPGVTFHGLRHTHASQLIAEKVDIVTISKRLGHANPGITLTVYSHLFAESDAAAADAINQALGANPVPKRS